MNDPSLKDGDNNQSAAKDLLQEVFATISTPLLLLHADLRLHSANEAFYEQFRTTPEQSLGRKIYDLGNGQWDLARLRTLLEEVIPRQKVLRDYRVDHDFEAIGRRSFLLNARRIDSLDRILLAFRDITEQSDKEHKLEESNNRYIALTEISPEAILVNQDGRYVFANQAAARLLGVEDPQQVIGLSPYQVVPTENHDLLRGRIDEVLHQGHSVPLLDYQWQRLDGRIIDVEEIAGLIRWEGRRAIQVLVRDITERKQTMRQLAESDRRFRELADFMPQLVWTADAIGRMTYFNAKESQFVNITQCEDGSWDWLPLVFADDRKVTQETWQRTLEREISYQIQHRLRLADGTVRWFLSRAQPLFDSDGRVERWIGTSTDIHDMKQAQRELSEAKQQADTANQAKNNFIANMSHEIRTPMTIILSSLEILAATELDEKQQQLLDMANASSTSLLNIIDDVLDISKIEANRLDISTERNDLHDCVQRSVDIFTLQAEQKGLALRLHVSDRTPRIAVFDPHRLQQILTNLIGNAIKFTERGDVDVSIDAGAETLHLAVRDTGIGIEKDKFPQVFECFSQLDSSSTREHGGTGLGLAICKGLVELMGGDIWIESQQGDGSCFHVTIPLVADARQPDASVDNEAGHGAEALSAEILIVEDDLEIQQLLTMILEDFGCRTRTAGKAEEALRLLEDPPDRRFDLVLMDLQMPGQSGLDLARQIRRDEEPETAGIPIIALTAHAGRDTEEQCRQAGMNGYIAKPFDNLQLHTVIQQQLAESAG